MPAHAAECLPAAGGPFHLRPPPPPPPPPPVFMHDNFRRAAGGADDMVVVTKTHVYAVGDEDSDFE